MGFFYKSQKEKDSDMIDTFTAITTLAGTNNYDNGNGFLTNYNGRTCEIIIDEKTVFSYDGNNVSIMPTFSEKRIIKSELKKLKKKDWSSEMQTA